nr:MAG TPA: HOLLIDAY JUNCTION RESOLVASE [Caudoviricetes sp.]
MSTNPPIVKKPIHNLIIGIDPDTNASGWACIDLTTREVRLERLTIPEIARLLQEWEVETQEGYLDTGYTYRFVLENVWSNSHNRHIGGQKSPQAIAKTGYNLGRCAKTGEDIRDLICEYGFPIICQAPLPKVWKGTDRKITKPEIVKVCEDHRLLLPREKINSTNQDERDALLLAIHHLGTPIQLYENQRQYGTSNNGTNAHHLHGAGLPRPRGAKPQSLRQKAG